MTAPRYEALVKLAAGGMATVWIGTARGALGFRQLVAIKKPHPHLLDDPSFKEELIAEARLASMIRHANVVDVRDVEEDKGSISLVMDFIEGASLGELLVAASRRADRPRVPSRVAVRIACDALAGLHAAHELVDERSRPVGLVHRDVSPQNILVGEDGIARVTDFGVAKFARKNMQSTSAGSLKGKLAYMAPEYLRSEPIDRRLDVFALGVVLWEALTGQRCFRGESEAETFRKILEDAPAPISSIVPELRPLDDVVNHALEKSAGARFQNAAALARALEQVAGASGFLGSHVEVATTVKELCGAKIEERRAQVRSKLAHEPSLQSLGADTVMSPLTQDAPPTEPMPMTAAPETAAPPTVTSELARVEPAATLVDPAFAATLMTPTAPRFDDHAQPVTANSYEIERTPPPRRAVPVVPLVLGALVLGGLAVAGGMSLGRAGGAPAPSASLAPAPPPAATASAPVAIATSAPAPVASVVVPAPRPIALPKPIAAPKPVVAPSASTKRPPANPYE